MATAETVYADPSALLRLYVHHADSRMMSAWRFLTFDDRQRRLAPPSDSSS